MGASDRSLGGESWLNGILEQLTGHTRGSAAYSHAGSHHPALSSQQALHESGVSRSDPLQPLFSVLRVRGPTLRSRGLTSFWGRMMTVRYSGQASTSTSRLNGFLFLMWKRAPYTYKGKHQAGGDEMLLWVRVLPVAREVNAGVRRTWWGTSRAVPGLRLPAPRAAGPGGPLVRELGPTCRS